MTHSDKITLQALTAEDLPLLFQWINDRDVVLFNSAYKPVHEAQHKAWFEDIQTRRDLVIFGIRDTASGELIGSCQLHNIHGINRCAELQIRIGPTNHRNKGYGSEAVRLLIDFAFRDLNLNRVYLHVFSDNEPAIRVYEKTGFSLEGTLREAAYIDGEYVSCKLYSILKSDYLKNRTGQTMLNTVSV